jgi:hypothetical protein
MKSSTTSASGLYERCSETPFYELAEEDKIQIQWLWKLGVSLEYHWKGSACWFELQVKQITNANFSMLDHKVCIRPVRKVQHNAVPSASA